MKKKTIERRLAFAISEHLQLGVIIEAYAIDLTEGGDFSLSFRKVTEQTLDDHLNEIPEGAKEAIKQIDEYSDELIVKKFSKKNEKPLDFFRNFSEENFEKLLRPYIETRISKCLSILKDNNIPLYFQGKKKNPVSDNPIIIHSTPAEVVFNFERKSELTKYCIEISQNEKTIKILNSNSVFLTQQPCWLYQKDNLYWFGNNVDSKKIAPFFKKESIIIPKQYEEKYFGSFIKNAVKNFRVKIDGFEIERRHPTPEAHIEIEPNLLGVPTFSLKFVYDDITFMSNDINPSHVRLEKSNNNYKFTKTFRDKNFEKEIENFIISKGLSHIEGCIYSVKKRISSKDKNFYVDRKLELLEWLNNNNDELNEKRIKINTKIGNSEKYHVGKVELRLDIEENQDWFDLHGIVCFGEIRIPFIRLKNHIINGIREFELPNGEKAIIPEEWFSKYGDVLKFSKNDGEKYKFEKHHFKLISKLSDNNEKGSVKKLSNLAEPKRFEGTPVPGSVKAELRPYQIEGYNWLTFLRKNNLNGCLADDMGLGKTIQTLTTLVNAKLEENSITNKNIKTKNSQPSLFNEEDMYPKHTSLIVMPLSLVHNWENEINKFTPQLKIFVHTGIKREQDCSNFHKYDIILTTYGVVRNDIKFLREFEFFYLILDESQVIKNPTSKIFKSIKKINAKNKLTLTGTPIENSLSDLWAQMTFLNDGLLGNLQFFKDYFQTPIEKHKDLDKQIELQELIKPFILRRTKKNVAKDLPELTTHIYYCEMEDEQRKIYEEQKSAIRNLILENIEKQGKEKSQFIILNGLMQLRLLANHPKIAKDEHDTDSGKFNEVKRSIKKLMMEGHNVLIFSSFVKHLTLIKNYLEKKEIKYSLLTGETASKKREEQVKKFQDEDDTRIFLISLKAGGVGLNLTSADYVFILDPWWNPAAESQAINRTHRIGQTKNVFAYKFITRDSIEEKILNLQKRKQHLANELVNNNNPFKEFTEDEIKELFN